MKPQEKMFTKNYLKVYDQNKVYKFTSEGTPILEEASLCRCPFWVHFPRCIKSHVSPSPATQELRCFVCLESSIFSPSISPSVHLCNYNFRHQLLFLLPFLVPHHHDYCLSSATKDLCNTPLLLLQNNSDQAKKHLSTHHFLPNWVHWSLSWQHLKENHKKRDYVMI